jgi:hypothetical protein
LISLLQTMPRVEIDIGGELLDQLSRNLSWKEQGWRRPSITADYAPAYETIDRVRGLTIKIFADEHPPPHFHVCYQGEDASFSILDCTRLRGVRGLERFEETIIGWWRDNRKALIEKWNSSRPANCPVGPIFSASHQS